MALFFRLYTPFLHVVVRVAANTPGATIARLVRDSINTGVMQTVESLGERGATPPGGRPKVAAVNFTMPGDHFADYNATVPAGSANPTGTIARTSEVLRDEVDSTQGHFAFAPELLTCSSPD